MSEKNILNLFEDIEFKNAPSLLKCYFTLGEKISQICNEYDIKSIIKILKKNQDEIATIFTANSDTWTSKQIYEMIYQFNSFSKNSKEKTRDLINQFKIQNQKTKIEDIQTFGNEIIIYLNNMVLDINKYYEICSIIYAINSFILYEKMEMLTDEFDSKKFKELYQDHYNKISKTLTNIKIINKQIILQCTGTKKASFKVRRQSLI